MLLGFWYYSSDIFERMLHRLPIAMLMLGRRIYRIALLAATAAWLTNALHAAAQAGDSTANLYLSNPDAYLDQRVDLEISYVEIVPAVKGKGIEGLTFIFANTYDFDNHCNGGKMLIIVQEQDVEKVRRKYGTILDKSGGGEPETKRLRATLRMVGDSMVYIDYSDEIYSIVEAHYDEMKSGVKGG